MTLACRLAREKAAKVAAQVGTAAPGALVIAADTVVAQDDALLGKPATPAEAVAMLQTLRSRRIKWSALSASSPLVTTPRTVANTTQVTMRAYTDAEIAAYVATGDPMDKAGAYAIQHAAFNPVAQMEGCYSAVMGLPLGDFADLLAEFGVTVPQPVAPIRRAHGARSAAVVRQIDSLRALIHSRHRHIAPPQPVRRKEFSRGKGSSLWRKSPVLRPRTKRWSTRNTTLNMQTRSMKTLSISMPQPQIQAARGQS
ncbi:MAG: Maf family protein [Caldilineaceae bacterium]